MSIFARCSFQAPGGRRCWRPPDHPEKHLVLAPRQPGEDAQAYSRRVLTRIEEARPDVLPVAIYRAVAEEVFQVNKPAPEEPRHGA